MPKIEQCQRYYERNNIQGPDSKDYFNKCGIKLSKRDTEVAIGMVRGFNSASQDPKGTSVVVDLICYGSTGG
jgi:hypothetical protein